QHDPDDQRLDHGGRCDPALFRRPLGRGRPNHHGVDSPHSRLGRDRRRHVGAAAPAAGLTAARMAPGVLVVGAAAAIQALTGPHLSGDGFGCRAAGDGAQALALLRARVPDLVVLDLMLPGIDGLELTRRVRAEPAWARLPIIMLTAKGDEIDRIVGLEMGADDYIAKPF